MLLILNASCNVINKRTHSLHFFRLSGLRNLKYVSYERKILNTWGYAMCRWQMGSEVRVFLLFFHSSRLPLAHEVDCHLKRLKPTPCCILNLKLPINTQLQVNMKITINQFLKLVTLNFSCSFNSNACCIVVSLSLINRTTSVSCCRLTTHNRPKNGEKKKNFSKHLTWSVELRFAGAVGFIFFMINIKLDARVFV